MSTGDIGPKFGTNANDNGYLRLDRVRIPRDQMLMRFSKVSREGRYSTPPHAKLAYGTMVIVRASIVASAAGALAAAATIATRYSIVRAQGYKVRFLPLSTGTKYAPSPLASFTHAARGARAGP